MGNNQGTNKPSDKPSDNVQPIDLNELSGHFAPITGSSVYVTKDDLSKYVPDLSGYLRISDLDTLNNEFTKVNNEFTKVNNHLDTLTGTLTDYAKVSDLTDYAKVSELNNFFQQINNSLNIYAKMSDISQLNSSLSASLGALNDKLINYAKIATTSTDNSFGFVDSLQHSSQIVLLVNNSSITINGIAPGMYDGQMLYVIRIAWPHTSSATLNHVSTSGQVPLILPNNVSSITKSGRSGFLFMYYNTYWYLISTT